MRSFQIAGIVNITSDSFSDGGQFLDANRAIAHAKKLIADSADIIDLGAESSNPKGQRVESKEEIERLLPVIEALKAEKVTLSVDTYKSDVIQAVVRRGVTMVNDITSLSDAQAMKFLADFPNVKIVMMFARNRNPRAEVKAWPYDTLLDDMKRYFDSKIRAAVESGISRERLILDPGMGFFLGMTPEPSLWVLKNLQQLKSEFNLPLYVCTSRKSFIGAITGRDIPERHFGTVATEWWAIQNGATYIRTHNVAALNDVWKMWNAIETVKI